MVASGCSENHTHDVGKEDGVGLLANSATSTAETSRQGTVFENTTTSTDKSEYSPAAEKTIELDQVLFCDPDFEEYHELLSIPEGNYAEARNSFLPYAEVMENVPGNVYCAFCISFSAVDPILTEDGRLDYDSTLQRWLSLRNRSEIVNILEELGLIVWDKEETWEPTTYYIPKEILVIATHEQMNELFDGDNKTKSYNGRYFECWPASPKRFQNIK